MTITASPDSPDEQKLVDELHQYCRHSMTLWVQWFTFFLTVNYVALGWFAEEIGQNQLADRRPLYYVAALFISQKGSASSFAFSPGGFL